MHILKLNIVLISDYMCIDSLEIQEKKCSFNLQLIPTSLRVFELRVWILITISQAHPVKYLF